MTFADVAATGAVVVQAIYAAATYHRDRSAKMASVNTHLGKRPFLIIGALMATTWAAVGYDLYDRHFAKSDVPLATFVQWGVKGQRANSAIVYTGAVDTSKLIKFENTYRLMLITRMRRINVDRFYDNQIEKSITYSIDTPVTPMEIRSENKTAYSFVQPNTVEFYAVMIPNSINYTQIETISDVKRDGGVILAEVAEDVMYHTSSQFHSIGK